MESGDSTGSNTPWHADGRIRLIFRNASVVNHR